MTTEGSAFTPHEQIWMIVCVLVILRVPYLLEPTGRRDAIVQL
jgi:hypothetical protein